MTLIAFVAVPKSGIKIQLDYIFLLYSFAVSLVKSYYLIKYLLCAKTDSPNTIIIILCSVNKPRSRAVEEQIPWMNIWLMSGCVFKWAILVCFKALLSTDQDRARFKVEGNLILDLNGLSSSDLVILLSLRPLKFHNVSSKSQIYSKRNHHDQPLRECDECPFSHPLNSGSTHIKYLFFISYSN